MLLKHVQPARRIVELAQRQHELQSGVMRRLNQPVLEVHVAGHQPGHTPSLAYQGELIAI